MSASLRKGILHSLGKVAGYPEVFRGDISSYRGWEVRGREGEGPATLCYQRPSSLARYYHTDPGIAGITEQYPRSLYCLGKTYRPYYFNYRWKSSVEKIKLCHFCLLERVLFMHACLVNANVLFGKFS